MTDNLAPDVSLAGKMQRGELMDARCPSREILKHITSRWGVLVLIALAQGTQRFSELRRKVGGVSEKMLSQTLQWLEDDGLVVRESFPVMPPHVEYSLSPLGEEVGEKVEALADWIEFHLPHIMRARARLSPRPPLDNTGPGIGGDGLREAGLTEQLFPQPADAAFRRG